MKKILILLCCVILTVFVLAGCGEKEDTLMSVRPFPEFSDVDMDGNKVTNEIFSQYDATIINFWSNGCGTCIEEMPELEEMYHNFKDRNINLIGVGADSGTGEDMLEDAKKILESKGVTYMNISPDPEGALYDEIYSNMNGFPTTYVVDSQGNIIGAPITGNVKMQLDTLEARLEQITSKGK